MFFFMLLPITCCLANASNTTQQSNITSSVLQSEFIWKPPPSLEWPPKFTHHHHHHLKPWSPLSTYGPSYPFKFFPDNRSWLQSRHKRFPLPHHHHDHLHHGHHHHHDFPHGHHHHNFHHPLYDFHNLFSVNKLLPTKESSQAQVSPERKEDQLKSSSNTSEMIELNSRILSTMENLMSARLQTQVEILKSIEMEYDPVLKQFVEKKDKNAKPISDSSHSNKKRSDASETSLFTPETKKNLQSVFTKFEKEQINNGIAMRDKKNFQTGRFKSKHHDRVPGPVNPNILPGPVNPNILHGNNSLKNHLFELNCNVKSSRPKMDSIPSATVRPDRFAQNVKWRHSDLSQRGDGYTDYDNNSISVYVDDPNFFNFLHGNWSKGGVPIMLTALSPNSKVNDHTNCKHSG